MKAPLQHQTKFSCSVKLKTKMQQGAEKVASQILFEGRFQFRDFLQETRATFETTSFSTVAEPFIDLWTPNALVFTIAWYNVLQFIRCQCSHANFTRVH